MSSITKFTKLPFDSDFYIEYLGLISLTEKGISSDLMGVT